MNVAAIGLDPSGGRKDLNGLALVTLEPGGPRVARTLQAFKESGRKTRTAYLRLLVDVLAEYPDHHVITGVEANGAGLNQCQSIFEQIARESRPGGALADDAYRITLFGLVIAGGHSAAPQRVPESPPWMHSVSRHAAVNRFIHEVNLGARYPEHADALVLRELDEAAQHLYAEQAGGWEARGDRVDHRVSVTRGGPGDDAMFALLCATIAAEWGARRRVQVHGPVSAGLLAPP